MSNHWFDLKVCDVCLRSEITPIIEGEKRDPLGIRFDNSRKLWICEDCEEQMKEEE